MSPRAAWRLESLGFTDVYDYGPGKQDWFQAGLPAEGRLPSRPWIVDVCRRDVTTCSLDERLGDVRERANASGLDVAVVVNERRVVLGMLRGEQLDGDSDARIADAMRPGPSTFRANVPAHDMATFLAHHDMANAPVTTPEGELIGVVVREEAARAAVEAGHDLEHRHDDEEDGP